MSTSDGRDGVQEILDRLPLLVALPEDARRLVVQSFEPVSFGFGSVIVEEGRDGRLALRPRLGDRPCAQAGSRRPGGLAPGAQGRRHVRRGGPARRAATGPPPCARAARSRRSSSTRPSSWPRSTVEPEIGEQLEQQISRYRHRDLFRLSSAFSRIADETLDDLIDSLEPLQRTRARSSSARARPRRACSSSRTGGLRAVWQTEDGTRGDVAYLRRGDFFGERSLLLGAPRAVTHRGRDAGVSCSSSRRRTSGACSSAMPASATSSRATSSSYEFKFVAPGPARLRRGSSCPAERGRQRAGRARPGRRGAGDAAREPSRRRGVDRRDQGGEAQPDPPLPARVAGRRDGLRRRLPRDG